MGFVIRSHYPAWVNNVSGQLKDIIMWLKKPRKVRCNCSDLRTCTRSQCFNFSFLNTQHDKNSIIPQKSDQQLAFIPRGREREGTFLNLKLSWTRCPAAAWLRTILKLSNCIHIGGVYILLYFWVSKTAYKSSNKIIYSPITIQYKVQSQLYFLTCFPA